VVDLLFVHVTGTDGTKPVFAIRLAQHEDQKYTAPRLGFFVKAVMHATAARLRSQGEAFEAAATHIEQASTHWLRHTAASHLSERANLKVVRDNLGTPT
jgi:site-specific recombinase XerD